jgi:hypothetical protein
VTDREIERIRAHKYYLSHRDEIRTRTKLYYETNKDKAQKLQRAYYVSHQEKIKERSRIWRNANPDRNRENIRRWFSERPEQTFLRKSVKRMIKASHSRKMVKSEKYVGCTAGFLRNHIESLFKPGMTWENRKEWHVDHIVPLSWFPVDKDPSLLFVASHWTNLQPIWGEDNIAKGSRYAD